MLGFTMIFQGVTSNLLNLYEANISFSLEVTPMVVNTLYTPSRNS